LGEKFSIKKREGFGTVIGKEKKQKALSAALKNHASTCLEKVQTEKKRKPEKKIKN